MNPRPQPRWPHLFLTWTVIGVILTVQVVLAHVMPGDPPAQRWFDRVWFTYLQLTRAWLWALLTPLVFELRRRIPVRGAWRPAGVLLHAGFCVVLTAWITVTRGWLWALLPLPERWTMPFVALDDAIWQTNPRMLIDVMLYAGTLGAGYVFDVTQERLALGRREAELQVKLAANELEHERLRSALVQAEMKALKQRLHPHFLFNALNAVAGLIRQGENTQAVEALARVSALLRALIGSTGRPTVALEEELAYCRTYLEIEKLRFDARLDFSIAAEPGVLAAEVPTLLLQPIVENAIKHGIAGRRRPGEVRITAALRDGRLWLEVRNDPAENRRGAAPAAGHGVGLATTRERMTRAYGADFRLDFQLHTPAGTVVQVELPFQPVPQPALAAS